jgi:DNA-binding MarR family transcriptional regulator
MIFADTPMTSLVGLASGICVKSRRLTERRLRPLGLTFPQFGALAAIAELGGGPQRAVAARLETDVNTAMVVCAALEKKGLATRKRDPRDSRALVVNLSPAGRSLLSKAMAEVGGLIASLPSGISAAKVGAALDVLGQVYQAMKIAEEDEDA